MKEPTTTYWITRDRMWGELVDRVDVWLVEPRRHRCEDGDVVWMAPLDVVDREATYAGEWTLGQAYAVIRNAVPSTDLECVRKDIT